MAGDWIKMRCNLDTDPAVFQMAAALGLDELAVVGRLWKVWAWADQHTKDGSDITLRAAAIDKLVCCEGFAAAMRAAKWLTGEDGALSLPGFDRHNGATAKTRSAAATRVAKHRAEIASGGKSFPRGLKRKIKARDNATCVYCGRKEGEVAPHEVVTDGYMHIDHVFPEARGGSTTEDNLVTSCGRCNKAKGARTPDEAGLKWPLSVTGFRYGCNEPLLQSRYQRREEKSIDLTQARDGFALDEVIEAGRRASIPEDVCRAYHDDREGAGWLDGKGRRVSSMPHDLSGFWRKWQSNRSPKQFGNGTVNGHGNPKPEGVWQLQQRIDAAQKEIDRISGNPSNKEQVPGTFDRRLKAEPMAKVKALKASISEMRQRLAGVEVAA